MQPRRQAEMAAKTIVAPNGLTFRVKDARIEAKKLKRERDILHTHALHVVAQSYGYKTWSHLLNDWR